MLAHTILIALLFPALAAIPEAAADANSIGAPAPAAEESPAVPVAAESDRPLATPIAEAPLPPPGAEPPAPPASAPAQAAPVQQAETAPAELGEASESGRPPRVALGLSLGMNTISANGLQLLWRTSSHFGWALGGGFGSSLLRYGVQGRFYLQPLVSSPYFGFDLHGNSGRIVEDSPRHDSEGNETGETFSYTTEFSVFFGAALGWHLVWGPFFLDPTLGWSFLVGGGNYFTDPAPGQLSDDDRKLARGDRGGLQLGLTAGLTW